ncbi:hypothetical protein ACLOJK_022653 [Asimina triloba]
MLPTATARAAHVPPPVLPAARRSLPPHRHHPPATRTVHQRPRLLGPSRQQCMAHSVTDSMQLECNKIY